MKTKHKILIISDTHTQYDGIVKRFDLPPADFIIHCGDISGRGGEYATKQFLDWFNSLYQYDSNLILLQILS